MASSWQSVVNSVMPGRYPQTAGLQNIVGFGPLKRKRIAAEVDEDLGAVNGNAAAQASRPLERQRQVRAVQNDNEVDKDMIVMQTSDEWQLATEKRTKDATVQDTGRGQASKRSWSSMEHGAELDNESEIDTQLAKRQRMATRASDGVRAGVNMSRSVIYVERPCQSSNEKYRHGAVKQSSTAPKRKKVTEKRVASKPTAAATRSRPREELKAVGHRELYQTSFSKVNQLGVPGISTPINNIPLCPPNYLFCSHPFATDDLPYDPVVPSTERRPDPQSPISGQSQFSVSRDVPDNNAENYGDEISQIIYETYPSTRSSQRPPQPESYNDFAMVQPPLKMTWNADSGSQVTRKGNHGYKAHTKSNGPPMEHTTSALNMRNRKAGLDSGGAYFAVPMPNAVDLARDPRSMTCQPLGPRKTNIAQTTHAGISTKNAVDKSRDPRLMRCQPVESGITDLQLTSSRVKRNSNPTHLARAGSSTGDGRGTVPNGLHPVLEGEELRYKDSCARTGIQPLYGDEAIDDMFSIAPLREDQALEGPLFDDPTLDNLPLYDPALDDSTFNGPPFDDPMFEYHKAEMEAFVNNLEEPKPTRTSRSTVTETRLSNGSIDYGQLPVVLPAMSMPHLDRSDHDDEVRYQQGLAAKGKPREEDDGFRSQNPASISTRSLTTDMPVRMPMYAPQKDGSYQAMQLPEDEQLVVELAAAFALTDQDISQVLQETIKEYFSTEPTAVTTQVEHEFHKDLQLGTNEHFPTELVPASILAEDHFSQAFQIPGDETFSAEDLKILDNSDLYGLTKYLDE